MNKTNFHNRNVVSSSVIYTLSPLLFVVTMTPLTLILRKCEVGYIYANNTKLNRLLFLDDLKLYARNENRLDSLMQNSENNQQGHWYEVWHRKMCCCGT